MGRTSGIGRRPRSELSRAAAAVVPGDIYDTGTLGRRDCGHSWHRSAGLSHRRRPHRGACLPGTGYARPGAPDRREIVWQHYPGDWQRALSVVNNAVCAMSGEVRPRKAEEDFEVVYDVAELIWEPLD